MPAELGHPGVSAKWDNAAVEATKPCIDQTFWVNLRQQESYVNKWGAR